MIQIPEFQNKTIPIKKCGTHERKDSNFLSEKDLALLQDWFAKPISIKKK